jgi:DNA polymerase-3 subunit gamma/tau
LADLLALKWRPSLFGEVIGQDDAVALLRKTVLLQRYFPCYLVSGPYGSGKTTLARIFSKAILCDGSLDGEPCGSCESCRQFDRIQNPNYEELDSASHGSVEDIRRLRESAFYRPFGGKRRRVVYLDEAGSISHAGNNAFLKLLEEGSETVVFVMTTTEPDRILETVKSRAFEIDLRRLTPSDIYSRLVHVATAENIQNEDKALRLIATYSQGHMRDALMLLDQMTISGSVSVETARSMLKVDSKLEYLKLLHALASDFNKVLEVLDQLETRRVPLDIWKGLLEATVDCYLVQKNVEPELDPAEVGWVKRVLEQGATFLTSTMSLLSQLQTPHSQVELRFNICQIAEKVGRKASTGQTSSAQDLRGLARKSPVVVGASRATD